MTRSVEPNLQGNLYHYATDCKGGIGCRTRCRERPRTQQRKSFDNMVILRYISNCAPEKPHHGSREGVEKRWLGLVVASTNAEDYPEQQRRRG
jgi:hypothetical protein